LHHTAQSIENCLGRKVLGGNKIDEVLLAILLLQGCQKTIVLGHAGIARLLENVIDLRIGMFEILREKLELSSISQP